MTVENIADLEKLLRLALRDETHCKLFYDTLLNSTIYILAEPEDDAPNDDLDIDIKPSNQNEGTHIAITLWQDQDGQALIPIFSSLEILSESVDHQETYLAIEAKELFELTLGASLILNPLNECSKTFTPEEIRYLLQDGTDIGFSHDFVDDDHSNYYMRQPEEDKYPHKLVKKLSHFFENYNDIKSAYLTLIYNDKNQNDPSLVIGIEGEGDLDDMLDSVAPIIENSIGDDEYIDFVQMSHDADDMLSAYLRNDTKPFYISAGAQVAD